MSTNDQREIYIVFATDVRTSTEIRSFILLLSSGESIRDTYCANNMATGYRGYRFANSGLVSTSGIYTDLYGIESKYYYITIRFNW